MTSRRVFATVIILLFSIFSYGQEIADVISVEVDSKILNQKREILISTPSFYNETKLVDFDLILVFDSQNRESFDLVHSSINFMKHRKRYIVVGVTSPAYEELRYYRNNDMLPEPESVKLEDYQVKQNPNSQNFLRFVKEEVIPMIHEQYRTSGTIIAVGHSLSASFILSSFVSDGDLFDAYIAISPNFAYDKNRLAKEILKLEPDALSQPKFLYISNADEANYWSEWKIARELVYSYFKERDSAKGNQITTVIEEYPNTDHWDVYLPSFISGFQKYLLYSQNSSETLSEEFYDVTITVKVPDENDNVYITGDQEALANWNPDVLQLDKISDFERRIKLKIQNPAQIQFTRGTWETKAFIKETYEWENIRICPTRNTQFEFEILEWLDKVE